jgi:predicted nucleic acid-binding Zn finger protein
MKQTIIHGSKGDYIVTEESCTCPDYVYRKKDTRKNCLNLKCKHMRALEE